MTTVHFKGSGNVPVKSAVFTVGKVYSLPHA